MKNSDAPATGSALGRRDFMKIGAGGAMLTALPAAVAAETKEKGVDWWDAKPGKGGVGKPVAIDCHAHWSPEPYNKALADLGQPLANPYPLNYDLEKRLQWMDEHGVLMHCLTLSGSMPWQWTSAEQGAHLAQIINDTGIEVHKKHPDRFVLGIEMPVRDPQLALEGIESRRGKAGRARRSSAGLDGAARLHHRSELCAGPRANRGIGPARLFFIRWMEWPTITAATGFPGRPIWRPASTRPPTTPCWQLN